MDKRWESIPIKMTLELGAMQLSFSECAQLTIGSRLQFPTGKGDPLSITSGGRLVGHGRLTLADDNRTLACEITDWLNTGKAAEVPTTESVLLVRVPNAENASS